jgi:hypothetical protein
MDVIFVIILSKRTDFITAPCTHLSTIRGISFMRRLFIQVCRGSIIAKFHPIIFSSRMQRKIFLNFLFSSRSGAGLIPSIASRSKPLYRPCSSTILGYFEMASVQSSAAVPVSCLKSTLPCFVESKVLSTS